MDDLLIIDKLKKITKNTLENISTAMMSGNVDSMEKYKYMLGQAQAYTFISGEISNLLNKGAKDGKDADGKIVNIGKDRSPKV